MEAGCGTVGGGGLETFEQLHFSVSLFLGVVFILAESMGKAHVLSERRDTLHHRHSSLDNKTFPRRGITGSEGGKTNRKSKEKHEIGTSSAWCYSV